MNIAIESRFTWDRVLQFSFPGQVLAELKFWNENIKKLNSKKLMNYSISSVLIYSDASSIGAAAYSVELENKVFHRMWELSETLESSSWRELNAIEPTVCHLKMYLKAKLSSGLLTTRIVSELFRVEV